MTRFAGIDHLDVRVPMLSAVEAFYDRFFAELGLGTRTTSYVDAAGDWHSPSSDHAYNTVEYYEPVEAGAAARFIGIIEDPGMQPGKTRIAFRVVSPEAVREWAARLAELGARNVQVDPEFDTYPAVFFEDPCGTHLELCARKPSARCAVE